MSPVAIFVLALSMSVDAFAASLVKGATSGRPRLVEAVRTGLIFGCVETCAPIIGWLAGIAASEFIQAIDHWIALILLSFIGGKMIRESFAERKGAAEKPQRHSLPVLIVTAIGTSIDSVAMGVMIALLGANIIVVALCIGAATFTMTTIGMTIGHTAGAKLGAHAERIGGICLVLLGLSIFLQHTLGL